MATPYSMLIKAAQRDLRDNIRDLAKVHNLTLADLARTAEMKYALLTQALAGNRWFAEDEVAALANALEVAVDELMGQSVFKADARGSQFDRPHPARAGADIGTGNGRAICCGCGTFRRFTFADVDYLGTNVADLAADPLGRRSITNLKCRTCGHVTLHAELRQDRQRDIAEEVMYGPTKEQEAAQKRDRLVTRLSEFNVDVHFRHRGRRSRAEGYGAMFEYDDSKSQWRIEISPALPTPTQLRLLEFAWKKISTADFDDCSDWDPREGTVIKPAESDWDAAVEALIEDIKRSLPVDQQKLRLEVADEVALDAARSEVDR